MIKTVGIIGGTGKMGEMFAHSLGKIGVQVMVSDEHSPEKEQELLDTAELLILSVPIEVTPVLAKRIGPRLRSDQIFSDFTSVKTWAVPAMQSTTAEIISAHPLFGPMDNMAGQNMVLLPVRTEGSLPKVRRLYQKLGLKVKVIEPWEKHDEMMSVLQSLIHFMHIVFSHTLELYGADIRELIEIASPVYRANFAFACRIMNRSPELYTHILMDNPSNKKILSMFLKEAEKTYQNLLDKDAPQFIADFHEVKKYLGDMAEEFSLESEYLVEKMAEFKPPSALK